MEAQQKKSFTIPANALRPIYAFVFVALLATAGLGVYFTIPKADFSNREEFVNLYATVFCDDGEEPEVLIEVEENEHDLFVEVFNREDGQLLRCDSLDISGTDAAPHLEITGFANVVVDAEVEGLRCRSLSSSDKFVCRYPLIVNEDGPEMDVSVDVEVEQVERIYLWITDVLQKPSLSDRRLAFRLSTHQYPSNHFRSVPTFVRLSPNHSIDRATPAPSKIDVLERGVVYSWEKEETQWKHRRVVELQIVNETRKSLAITISLVSASLLGALFGALISKLYTLLVRPNA